MSRAVERSLELNKIETGDTAMISKIISVVLVPILLHGSIAAQDQPQSPQNIPKVQQVLRKAQEKNKAVKVTLNKKVDSQTKFTGKVSEISDGGFTLIDQKSGKPITLAYADVLQVKQKGLSRGAKVAIGVGVGVAVFLAVAVIAVKAAGID